MAKLCQHLPAFLFLFCVASLNVSSHAGNLSFAFPPLTDIKLENDAYAQRDKLQLTRNEASGDLYNSSGWVVYNKSIPLWDNSSRALSKFSTHFQFIIGKSNDNQNDYGDGLAFFLAPFELEPPENPYGGGLGLFNATTFGGSFYQMVAVEFDTYMNGWDPDDNHVGINVNSIFSKVYVSLSNITIISRSSAQNLKNGERWDAWVDYDGGEKRMQVFLLYNSTNTNFSKPKSPLLSYDIDLRDFLPENVEIGLSASTGDSTETHTVISWNFSCEYSWEISPAASPKTENISIGKDKEKINSHKAFLISLFCILVAICGFVFLGWRWNLRYSKRGGEAREEIDVELDEWLSQGPRRFSYAELSAATRNFCEDEKLGQGGFGSVYRGVLPGTMEAVAVKRISQGSNQGRKEYVSEVTIINKLRHRNLVQLLGWCHEKGELLLVYEYLSNGSLDKYIFGKEKDTLPWHLRYSIACDIACALVYLHEEWVQQVVHRDVKASNIMLDSDFNAKLGDFGLARVVERDQTASHTTVVAGTLGYLAPECVITGKASPEADVYSFGAVTLEIACGRRPVDHRLRDHNDRLVEWVWDLYGEGKLLHAGDEKLGGNFNAEEMERLMLVGLLCSHPDPTSRPTMREVMKILKWGAELPYVPLDLPVAVYNQPIRRDVTSASIGIGDPSMSSSSSVVKTSVLSFSTSSTSSLKMSSPLLFQRDTPQT
ncbi:L-type lectin-domain containing receptor kinase IX.1-like [Cryptomeria japonica]|uniref:L-type lectin-domain containing receptor kinase IX.1-like n=1 Tax=Cryptomeria japonica TaxID=3369 RepID=UPI0027DA683B|nr:L-type lectin-domain containing receptor kinase IX.1-like [Cryptomeria japonica]